MFACSREQSQTPDSRRFCTGVEHPLHSDADAEERHALFNSVENSGPQPSLFQDGGSRKVADTGQNNLVCMRHHFRVASDDGVRAQMIQRLLYGGKISGAIVTTAIIRAILSCWGVSAPC